MVLMILVLGMEFAARLHWQICKGVPIFRTGEIWNTFYPEFKASGVETAPTDHTSDTFHVLILSASVFYPGFGDLPERFNAALTQELHRPVRIYNLSYPGRTTRDNFEKYRHLGDKRFDLVIVYDGVNDSFLNNCPSKVFRSDYTHAPRFEQILLLDRHPEHPYFVLPYSARYLKSRLQDQWRLSTQPGPYWFQYACDLKTPQAFETNLRNIIEIAETRGDTVLLMTYALYVPTNYSEEAFAAKTLDYGVHLSPLSLWGTVASVPAAVDAHNAAARRLAARHPGVAFVDQQRLMPTGKLYFNDPCHLTAAGCEAFVANVMKKVNWTLWSSDKQSKAIAVARKR
jgi:hypothetical protein